MQSSEKDLANLALNDSLWKELEVESKPLDLAKIKRLLEEAEEIGCYAAYQPHGANGDSILLELLTKARNYQAGELQEIAKLWAEKRGKDNCGIALECMFRYADCNKEARFEIIKGLVAVTGVRAQVWVTHVEKTLPVLALVLTGIFPCGHDIETVLYNPPGYYNPTAYIVNLELLKYFLTNGGGADLVTVLDTVPMYSLGQIPELSALWDIIKLTIGSSNNDDAIGENMAIVYLHYAGREGSARQIIDDKENIIKFIHSPKGTQYLPRIIGTALNSIEASGSINSAKGQG